MVNKDELLALIDKFLAGKANNEETERLIRYYDSFQQDEHWNETELGPRSDMEASIFKGIREKIRPVYSGKSEDVTAEVKDIQANKVISMRQKRTFLFLKIGIAASVAGIMLFGAYSWLIKDRQKNIAATEINNPPLKNDALPAGDKAVLTLSDGSQIILDSAADGNLTSQGTTKVIKMGGRLSYSTAKGSTEVAYNTITTPRGGKYMIELPDGTLVWLNAASSLHFPTAFAGKERSVDISGEAYFEVAKNKAMPFIVHVNAAEIRVTGTHFNVMAYKDEDAVKTTLLEGAVTFTNGKNSSLLKPGQQSRLSKEGQLKVVNDVNMDEVMAWKNGMFHFENAKIETVMRQLSDWYDVEVVYPKKDVENLFYAEIRRDTKLSDVLKALELTGKVKFTIEDRKIIVIKK